MEKKSRLDDFCRNSGVSCESLNLSKPVSKHFAFAATINEVMMIKNIVSDLDISDRRVLRIITGTYIIKFNGSTPTTTAQPDLYRATY